MKEKNKDLQIDLSILGLTTFLVIVSILFLFGFEFYDEDIELEGIPFGSFEVTTWIVSFTLLVVFGIKAFFQSFKCISTNVILVVFGTYLLFVLLSLWNAYNEMQEIMAPFQ